MFVYKRYDNWDDVEKDFTDGGLQYGYIFSLHGKLWRLGNDAAEALQVPVFRNKWEKEKITGMCDLHWMRGDRYITEDDGVLHVLDGETAENLEEK